MSGIESAHSGVKFLKGREQLTGVDAQIRNYLQARKQPLTSDEAAQQQPLLGKCVARQKSDAKIVAFAEDHDALERVLAEQEIDPESVVIGIVDDARAVTLYR